MDDGLFQDPQSGCFADTDDGSTTNSAPSATHGNTDGGGDGSTSGSNCYNGIQDGDETEVDCGGSCGNTCGEQGSGDSADESGAGTPSLWCLDTDGDGFGDPDDCVESIEPIDGRVPNDDDCDDSSATTFPGAAELELDAPDACRQDSDEDGWGDADPSGGPWIHPGSDCHDNNGALSPSTLALTAFLPYRSADDNAPRSIASIDVPLAPSLPIMPADRFLDPMVTLLDPQGMTPSSNIVTSALASTGRILGCDTASNRLHDIEYDTAICPMVGTVTPTELSYADQDQGSADLVCGVEFGPDGNLYGISHNNDLITIDPTTGERLHRMPLDGINIFSCGMAFDCRENRLLIANGYDQTIYEITEDNLSSAGASIVVDLSTDIPGPWEPTGLAYNPVTGSVWLSTGMELHHVDLMGGGAVETVGRFLDPVTLDFAEVSNLQYLPQCE